MKQNIYPKVESNQDLTQIEKEILQFWQEEGIFEQSVENRPADIGDRQNEFIFYDGPPFANGLPHYGHLLTGFIKDAVARYQTINGKKVARRFGWDCHGLPAEMGAEKELGFSGRMAITEYGIDKFNEHCKKSVMKYANNWQEYVNRQARWVDFENSYKTMDKNFMESVIWAFKQLYDKGLIYKSMRVMPYSWACQTPLSNFETRLDNSYRERADKAVTVGFTIKDRASWPAELQQFKQVRLLAWTTTPWTLPSNLALALGADIEYAMVPRENGQCDIIGKFAIAHYSKTLGIAEEAPELQTIKGSRLLGMQYEPLLPYFAGHKNAFKVLAGDFVEEGDGTGIVHIAPGFGEDDQILCQSEGIELVCPVDNGGKFTGEVSDFEGLQVFDANDEIIKKLKLLGSWVLTEQYLHNYPHCWRTDTPLIYKAVPSWYVEVTKFRHRMVELNQQINWIPGHVKDGLFGKWLEGAKDWSISRNRFFGTPIPVWVSSDPKYPRIDVYGSIAELEADFGVKVDDLHRPYIDELTRPNPDDPTGNSVMQRVEDVFDCWFESGSMPYGQAHYPFENKDWFNSHFPADFIVEYTAQTRGWFYTLMVLSTALFDRPPFLNCICHGVILDSTGQKLSKRLNNYQDPLEIFDKYGADTLRATMLASNVVKGQELLIDKDGQMVYDTLRLFIKPIWNAYHFFTLYANIDGVVAKPITNSGEVLDKYILAKLKIAVADIKVAMDAYDTQKAYQTIGGFFEVLNNWYIRRSRARFWQTQQNEQKISAYNALFTCLLNMMKASSPLLPLIAESIYKGITDASASQTFAKSVHLCDYPVLDNIAIDEGLVTRMDLVQNICSSALFIRSQENIRTRQPLSKLTVITEFDIDLDYFTPLIQEEINVKEVVLSNQLQEYATKKLNINFKLLGARLPAHMKDIIKESRMGNWQQLDNGEVVVAGRLLKAEEFSVALQPKVKGASASLAGNAGLIMLETELTQELIEEGIARDLIRLVQQARKEAGFSVDDRILLNIEASGEVDKVLTNHSSLIAEQTLSQLEKGFNAEYSDKMSLQGKDIFLELKRA